MLSLILLVFAFVCFTMAALGVSAPRLQLVPLGLAFWVLSLLIGRGGLT